MPMELLSLDPETRAFYGRTLRLLNESTIPYLVGGAYALTTHAGIERHTKDLDIFCRRVDRDRILDLLARAGFRTEIPFPHWLAKAHDPSGFVDLIYGSGNGIAVVDDEWFRHAVPAELLGLPVRLCPVEEILWSKAFIMERERFDGADIAHLLKSQAEGLDWPRLLRRFGDRGRVLLAHLILFGFIYPSERSKIPAWVLDDLIARMNGPDAAADAGAGPLCRGTLISREQYLVDIQEWGFQDARLGPEGTMNPREVAIWTEAIAEK